MIETKRLLLRPLVASDASELFEIYQNPQVMKYIGKGHIKNLNETQREIDWCQRQYEQSGFGLWATVTKEENKLIGRCGLLNWEIDNQNELEVGYLIDQPFWGRGLASEAALAIKQWAVENLRRDRLISLMYPENVGSIRVATKIGMTYEKEVDLFSKKVCLYSLNTP